MAAIPTDTRDNNVGLLRLVLASLVVVSHASILVDGDCRREIVTRMFGTTSFGRLAVDGFFLVSGYLITQSFVATPGVTAYLVKRVFRIVPGYAVSFALCVLVLAPLVGGTLTLAVLGDEITRMLCLLCPGVPHVLDGNRFSNLNGSMWTIAYEFRCYIATALLGLLGLYRPGWRLLLLPLVAALLVANASGALDGVMVEQPQIWGVPDRSVRFFGIYGVGALFFLFRERVVFNRTGAVLAAALLLPALCGPALWEAAFAILGGYLLFWLAFRIPMFRISRIAQRTDISYGIYLYAWPVQSALIYGGVRDPLILGVVGLGVAALAGIASWALVEKPCLAFARRSLRPPGDKAHVMPLVSGPPIEYRFATRHPLA